jgi:hypothetical protein
MYPAIANAVAALDARQAYRESPEYRCQCRSDCPRSRGRRWNCRSAWRPVSVAAFTPWVFTGAVSGGEVFARPRLSWRQVSVWWDFWEGFYPGYYGGYYVGYYGYGSCYLTVYEPPTVTDHGGLPGEHRSPASVPGAPAYCRG